METDFHSWALLVTCYQAQGELDKVHYGATRMVSEAQRALQHDPSNGAALGIIAGGYAILGEHERAREWIDRAMLIDPGNLNMKFNFACVLAAYVEDKDEALRLLDLTLRGGGEILVKIAEADPDFDCIRDDPRFIRIIEEAKERIKKRSAAPLASPPIS